MPVEGGRMEMVIVYIAGCENEGAEEFIKGTTKWLVDISG